MSGAPQWSDVIARLNGGASLSYEDAYWVMDQVMTGELGDARLASFLTSMAIKGATVDEIHGLADAMQDHALAVDLPSRSLDVVGTGGDGFGTVNISTMSAIALAAAGIPIVKHGNRASTSKSGSADVLEAMGVSLDVDAARQREIFDRIGIAFLFANKVHPSMRFAAPVRRALGFPTAFNVLGPLTNPARVQACAIGAAAEASASLMAGVYASRGLSTVGVNQAWIVSGGAVSEVEFDASEMFDMEPARIEDLRGGNARQNAEAAREVLSGGGGRAVRDAVCLNAAAGVLAWEGLDEAVDADSYAPRLGEAVERARRVLDSGDGAALVEDWAALSA